MRTKMIPRLLIAATLIFSASAFSTTLDIAGSTTVKKAVFDANLAAIKSATGLDVKFNGNGTGKGMIELFNGNVQVAAASENLADAVSSAKKVAAEEGKSVKQPDGLQYHELKIDSLVIIVNKENSISALSKEQLKNINTGKVKNWKEVGGPDLPIVVVTSHAGSATRAVFQKQIMDGADYANDATEARTTRAELYEVSREKGAIGALSEDFYAQISAKTKVVQAPAIKRPLGLITIGNPAPEVQKLIDFFKSAAGRKLLE